MVFSSWTPHGASGDTPPVGQRPEARQLPLAPASLGTPSSTALDLFNAVDRRHLAGDVFTLVDTVTGPTRYPHGIEDNTHRAPSVGTQSSPPTQRQNLSGTVNCCGDSSRTGSARIVVALRPFSRGI
jgi:hypothetical protein